MMERSEIVKILREAYCDDPFCCPFGLNDYDEKYNTICKATEPPCDPYSLLHEQCPFCQMVADLIEK